MRKKLTMLFASLFLVLGTAWAQAQVLKLTSEQINAAGYPYELSESDAQKVFALDELTVAVKVNTKTFPGRDNRMALFCTSDPAESVNTNIAMPVNSHYVALGTNADNVGYLASAKVGDRFTESSVSIPGNTNDIVLVFAISPTSFKVYKDGSLVKEWANQFMTNPTYEIATPKMVKEDYVNAKIYIGGGVKADKAFETFNGTITGVEVYDGVLDAEQVKNVFPVEFAPEVGKMYALKESSTGLFLDIQTLGINEPNANGTTNNISLNVKPCIIYFEAGAEGKWKMKNTNGGYVHQASSRDWNAVIGSTAGEWTVSHAAANLFTIARADGKFVGADTDKRTNKAPLYCDCDDSKLLKFSIVEYSDLNRNYCVLKSPSGTYLSLTQSGSTKASFQSEPAEFYITPSAELFYLNSKANTNNYVGFATGNTWDANLNYSLWSISEPNDEGLVQIVRSTKDGKDGKSNLGHDGNTNKDTGIYTNVGDGCFPWQILEKVDYATTSSVVNNKNSFTSDRIWYTAPCNTLRFTLTSSGAYYNNDKNKLRLSFDSFELYDANGEKVALAESSFSGNNTGKVFANMLDGANGTYCAGTWASGIESDWFELTLPNGVDLGGAFSFSYVTESGTHFANPGFRIDLSYKKLEKEYTFTLNVPNGKEASVTYDGKLVEGPITIIGEIDSNLIIATDISGYIWSATVDEVNGSVSITYTAAPIVENPEAVVALVNRIGGAGTANKFKFVLDPSINSKQETFVIGSENNLILIKGSTLSAITTGLGWYLNNIAHINIAWNSLNEKTVSGDAYVDLTNIELPLPAEETHVSDAKYRYYLNYCTFGYSMTSWTWKRWQQEIDWMALHGINMPLQIVGLEEVWRKFLTMKDANGNSKYGYSESDAMAFVAGPAFTAWWGMNNLEGWGGTGDNGWGGVQDPAWYKRQANLAKQITDLQRSLGMQPVLPGFSGMVPSNFATKTGTGTVGQSIPTDKNGGSWGGFTRPHIIDPDYANFAAVAADYYACLKEVMGESQYYSMDPFHEDGVLSSNGTEARYAKGYKNIFDAMEVAKSGSQWVIQQWQWKWYQKVSITAVPAGRLIALDLFSDGSPAFDGYNGYAPQDAVFCAIPNFGGRSGLMGRLQNVTDNYFKFKDKYASIKGIGTAPEAIEQTPVTYDLIYQLPWMNGEKPNVEEWVNKYSIARYGKDNAVVKKAWSLLRQGPLNYGADGIQGPVEDVWAARPNLEAYAASSWGSTLSRGYKITAPENTYNAERRQMLIDAVYKLIDQEDELALTDGSVYKSNYMYDLVEFGGGVMADYAHYLLLGIKAAKEAAENAQKDFTTDATYIARRDAFLQLILDMDAFRGTNLNFRLGKWTQEARDAAKEAIALGATTANEDWYEFNNARTIITTWGDQSQNSGLKDYSYRSWQGLLKDYYYPRWEYYFNNNCTGTDYFFFEWNWAHGMTHKVGDTQKSTTRLAEDAKGYSYTREPQGNTVESAKTMLGKYIIPIAMGDDTYYAYRTLINELSGKVTIYAPAGATADFAQYLGVSLEGATITGDAAEATAAGTYTATITLPDGTVLKDLAVVLQEYQFNGYYHISYETNPMFVGYNTDKNDTDYDVDGYKLIAGGVYTPEAEADKVFAIVPKDGGYTISAQGKYLEYPFFNWWKHVMFSDDEDAAGVYVFEDVESLSDVFKIRGVGEDDGDWVHNNYLQVYAPNSIVANTIVGSAHSFTITPAETYAVTLSGNGFLPLCLPFNVVLPEGVEACDINDLSKEKVMMGSEGLFTTIATAGQIVKAGTPMILKGTASASYALGITLNNNGAKTSLAGSVLRGNYVKQTLAEGTKRFMLNGAGDTFEGHETVVDVPANSCWIEADIEDASIDLIQKPSYTVTLSSKGYLPLYLPLNVVLPEGVIAYDINDLSKDCWLLGDAEGGLLKQIAVSGDILKARTAVILKGTAGATYELAKTLSEEGAKGSLEGSVLRGSLTTQAILPSDGVRKYVFSSTMGDMFDMLEANTQIPANSCWIEMAITADNKEHIYEDIDLIPNFITTTDGWQFRVKNTGKGITITDCMKSGTNSHLIIGSTYEVGGVTKEVVGVTDYFLDYNLDVTEVTLPATLTSVGTGYANPMFDITYQGADYGVGEGIGEPDGEGKVAEDAAAAEAAAWIGQPQMFPNRTWVKGASTWRMTVGVKIAEDAGSFNKWGSCLLATKEYTLANDYSDGSMQVYLRADRRRVVFKLDSDGDRDEFGLENAADYKADSLTFILENDGAGGYKIKVKFEGGVTEEREIVARDHAELHDFNTVWSSLGEGITVNVKFEKLTTHGLFVGCTNLTAIHVAEGNESFHSCDHGVLYNKTKNHVIRFPEGGGHNHGDHHHGTDVFADKHFEVPREVTRVYAGALHGVDADIIFHSNPSIMHVEGHEDHVMAKYYLRIEDDANSIDLAANLNTFQNIKYKREVRKTDANGKKMYYSVILPFKPAAEDLAPYEFYRFSRADEQGLDFSEVVSEDVEANVPYLFAVRDSHSEDVFETAITAGATPHTLGWHNDTVAMKHGDWVVVGCYSNEVIDVVKGKNANYYFYGMSSATNKLVRVTNSIKTKPYRMFFVNTRPVNSNGVALARQLNLNMINGTTTEITPEQIEGWDETELIYYDLQGRRVLNPENGIYIVNGKKVVIK